MVSFRISLVISLSVWMLAFLFYPTKNPGTDRSEIKLKITFSDSLSGKQLAMQYCQRCHLFPEPALLDKKTWTESVLPNMGQRLGLQFPGRALYVDMEPADKEIIKKLGTYPETALISIQEWEKIVAYYVETAPEKPLPQKTSSIPVAPLTSFKATSLTVGDKSVPKTTLLKFDPAPAQLYVGDDQNALYVLDKSFQLKDTWWIDTPPVDIDFPKNAPPRLLTIGKFEPSDQKLGGMISLSKSQVPQAAVNIANLPRPVQFTAADLNMDGKEDVIICGFGNNAGKLFWYDGFDPQKEHILKRLPGARKTEVLDLNRDKKPDIVALTSQAWENVSIFYNLGNGKFEEKVVLQFPPSYGVNYFEMVDFNKDGFQDILLTNGDNWDLSAIPKNYHGVRIYLNDGKDNFKEAWFYPLYGASKAMARDFDNDGDLDIAAVSFYTDLQNPADAFVYLSNEGNFHFKAQVTPEAASGKWMTMEAGDFDQDGDIDIALGSYFHVLGEMSKLMSHGVLSFPQLLLLTNLKSKAQKNGRR
ncbi:VCBS repeat-containing protein [Dyadobacter sp. CY323]|uniref:FG-GAP repeat domain-containing protein n=1 Tax=Dyadobacter sp. CY323 TaxID=2907302 RepID=UPI001F37E071|nr:VCBS repeat-containing protein [Dyadobacter sp. CY323]MCE6990519.1 VCBS repeat-containing protein [Dyadobacter sp. CY323]